jgi:hypothetical protein
MQVAPHTPHIVPETTFCSDFFLLLMPLSCLPQPLAVAPEFYEPLVDLDKEFARTEYFQKMAWLRHENDDLYDPSYTDMLRVAFVSGFGRGRLADLVALLSGRNFETREYEERIAEDSFKHLKQGVLHFMNETNFKRFVMIIRSAGFVENSMIRSQIALDFAYVVYLFMRRKGYEATKIESCVRRWFALSVLTGRYSSSPETRMDFDIRQMNEVGVEQHLRNVEKAELSDAFWQAGLPQAMNTSVASSPYFNLYLAAQVRASDKGFLSRDITVQDLITHKGDVHHLFPKNYLKKQGFLRGKYNQIANYVVMQSEINIAIGDRAPADYFKELDTQCRTRCTKYGAVIDSEEMKANFAQHCIPDGMDHVTAVQFEPFLQERRYLMAAKIRTYYEGL